MGALWAITVMVVFIIHGNTNTAESFTCSTVLDGDDAGRNVEGGQATEHQVRAHEIHAHHDKTAQQRTKACRGSTGEQGGRDTGIRLRKQTAGGV